MAADSRNVKKKRRQRRNLSLVTRQAQALFIQVQQLKFTLFQVLKEQGGAITIHRETTQAVLSDLSKLGWSTAAAEGGNGITLTLTKEPEPLSAQEAYDLKHATENNGQAGLSTVPGHDPRRDTCYITPVLEGDLVQEGAD